jgi:hypothetical protein
VQIQAAIIQDTHILVGVQLAPSSDVHDVLVSNSFWWLNKGLIEDNLRL